MNWWVTTVMNTLGVPALVAWIFWVIASITLHELAHGWAAIRCGDRTPIEMGRMTLNPVVHMGPASLIVFAIAGFAWGLMPVNPSRFRGRYDEALVALAGPAMNGLLAVLCTVAGAVWVAGAGAGGWSLIEPNEILYRNLQVFFLLGAMLNIGLLLLNLVPVPPLDGSRIVAAFFPAYRRAVESENFQVVAMLAFVGVFFFGSRVIFGAGMDTALGAREWLLGLIAPGIV